MPLDKQNPKWHRTVLLATDNSHSVIGEIADGKTNLTGYSAYGEQSSKQEVSTQLGFTGQLRESKIGWYLLGNGYRAYNPRLMRFHSPDSWSPFWWGGLNAYMYCVGDPVNRSDPTGHSIFSAAKLFVQENVSFGGSAAELAARNVTRRANGIARHQAMYGLAAAGGTSTPGARSSLSSGLTGMFGYVAGAPGPRGNRSPAIQYVEQTSKRHPGYVDGALADGLTHRGNRSSPNYVGTTSRGSGSRPTGNGRQGMPLWNADTIAAAQQPQTYTVYPVGVGSTPAGQGAVQLGNTSSSYVLPNSSARIGAPTHSSAVRPTAVVAAVRRDPPRSVTPSPPTSRDSTPPNSPRQNRRYGINGVRYT
ncbi:TPA: RHS repeat-associated core domain-containing protein [Pseudomonas putida]|nr:RHS repeat-associated core domain-containing protein [Pseudomonas putida]